MKTNLKVYEHNTGNMFEWTHSWGETKIPLGI